MSRVVFFHPTRQGKNHFDDKRHKNIVYIIELYAHTSPVCRYAHRAQIAEHVHSLAVDWHVDQVEKILPAQHSTHNHEQFNLDLLERRHLDTWVAHYWDISLQRVDWIHASFDCTTQSLAGAARAIHRRSDGSPKSLLAKQSDITIDKTLKILDSMTQMPRLRLCTIEQPQHSYFTRHSTVRQLQLTARWNLISSSHCASADEKLDGKVTSDPNCKALFPQKDSVWLVSGVPPYTLLPMCHADCRMLVPGDTVHRLLICRPSPSAHPLKKGQRVMRLSEDRERIPLGVIRDLWRSHTELRDLTDEADYNCLRCAGDQQTNINPLILCTQCPHIIHLSCTVWLSLDALPEPFLCPVCAMAQEEL